MAAASRAGRGGRIGFLDALEAATLSAHSDRAPAVGTNPPLVPAAGAPIPLFVSPDFILAQREAGWPDIHPEDYCHKCGVRNPSWFVRREQWLCATEAWAEQTGREGICCVGCFAEMFTEATGEKVFCEVILHEVRGRTWSTSPAATTPPEAAGVPSLLTQALGQLVAAQCAVARAGAALALVPFDDPARHRTDHLAIDVTRSVNELGGMVEALLNVGVRP